MQGPKLTPMCLTFQADLSCTWQQSGSTSIQSLRGRVLCQRLLELRSQRLATLTNQREASLKNGQEVYSLYDLARNLSTVRDAWQWQLPVDRADSADKSTPMSSDEETSQ